MSASSSTPKGRTHEATVPEALGAGVVLVGLFLFLKSPKHFIWVMNRISLFADRNQNALVTLALLLLFNFVWIAAAFSKAIRKSTGSAQTSEKEKVSSGSIKMAAFLGFIGSLVSWALSRITLAPNRLDLLPISFTPNQWTLTFVSFGFTACCGLGLFMGRLLPSINLGLFHRALLPRVPTIQDGIILGAIHEGESRKDSSEKRKNGLYPAWKMNGLKGLTGNTIIAASIGWGKSQILLQFLKQFLSNFETRPAILAIDPKRTFVRELRQIIETQGMSEHLVWISLQGETRMNPIWREGMLKNSGFTTIANTLKLASMNFIGGSGDSRIWEQLSYNLIKSSLIYCAAKYDYFTFKELYQALVQARDEGLASDLVDRLNEKVWDQEERGNIEFAIDYFSNEFSKMDEKIRSSILTTATGFINDFLEYRVSRILSPKKEEINFFSFKDAVREGKLICLNIENDALAKSIGTLIKLLYQEAVLDRVSDKDLKAAPYAILVMDEYQDVATSGGGAGMGDERFLARARESKSVTIAATQSVSSLENTIKSVTATAELLQGFKSRIFGNSTDPKTVRAFSEPRGTEEIERNSQSFSETSPGARADLIFGGFDSAKSNISQGTSTHVVREYPVTAKEFSRLRTFEAYAQIFDGLDTTFEKLYLKPYYLKNLRTSHQSIMAGLKKASQVKVIKRPKFGLLKSLLGLLLVSFSANADVMFPNVCSVIKASQFQSCLGFSVGTCMCGWPVPRPCAHFSYYVPQTFIEVWPNSNESFFTSLPGATAQLASHVDHSIPFGADDEMGSYAFQAHAVAVPFASETLTPLPCGGTRSEKPCFDLMSEDLGSNWSTGNADTLQPKYLAWGLAPKVCLLKGAVSGIAGGNDASLGADAGGCSYPLGSLPKYPPSTREACNGWGLFYPRSGIYEGGSRSAAALMVAARLKSLGIEVAHTVPGDSDELWQMLYPQSSSCFREGQNLGFLETAAGVREEQRIFGKPNGYLFAVWKHVSCCHDLAEVATAEAAIQLLPVACQAVPGGGV